jgi:sulfur carrier protein
MQISVNGLTREVEAQTLALLIEELGYGTQTVATALNHEFVRSKDRSDTKLREGDAVEILTPRQGG